MGFLVRDGEAVDRMSFFVAHLILLVVVVLLMRGSLISAYEVGSTANNWRSGLGMGVVFSVSPLGLFALVPSNVPPDVAREQLASPRPLHKPDDSNRAAPKRGETKHDGDEGGEASFSSLRVGRTGRNQSHED